MSADLLQTDHILLTGPTGRNSEFGGKTATATWFADNPARTRDLVIFLNTKQDPVDDVLEDYTEVATVQDAADAIADGARRVIITPMDPDWAAVSERLEGFIRALGSDLGSKVVILDEVPELDEDAVLSFVRVHGNGANCQAILIAQSPTDVSTSIVKQTSPAWVGPMKSDYKSWFETHDKGPAYRYIAKNQGPYEWTVVTGDGPGDWEHYPAVPERYAPP